VKKEEITMTLDDVLKNAEVKKENGKSKSKVIVLNVDDSIQQSVALYRTLDEQAKSLKTQQKVVKDAIIEKILPIREELMNKQGYQSSVRVPSIDGKSVTAVWSHSYSDIPMELKSQLEELVDDYSKYFATTTEIRVKDCSNETVGRLIELVGAERFGEFFEVDRNIVPTERYTEEFHKLENRELLTTLIKQREPSLKP
jgi:hypothetical protein